MNDVFATMVYPVCVRYCRKVFGRDEEKHSLAVAFAWYKWRNGHKKHPDNSPAFWARQGCRMVRQRREIPGLRSPGMPDIWDRIPHFNGAGMENVRDKGPGPARQAEQRELFARIVANSGAFQVHLMRAVASGLRTTDELASYLNLQPWQVKRLRKRIRLLCKRMGV